MERVGSQWRWLWRSLLITTLYVATALLAYHFADPASLASAIFPPAGIALEHRFVRRPEQLPVDRVRDRSPDRVR